MTQQMVKNRLDMRETIDSLSAITALELLAKILNISHRQKDSYVALFKQENNAGTGWTIVADKSKIGLPVQEVIGMFSRKV